MYTRGGISVGIRISTKVLNKKWIVEMEERLSAVMPFLKECIYIMLQTTR